MKQEFGLTTLQPLEANDNRQFPGFGGFSWQDESMTSAAPYPLIWTGTYTPDGGGRAEGIGALSAHPDGSLEWLGTAAKTDSPSFVAIHPTVPVV